MIFNQRGQTLISSLVGLALLGTAAVVFIGSLGSMKKMSHEADLMSSSEKQIFDIAENIRSGLENFQVNYDMSTDAVDTFLNPSSLPMAWDVGRMLPRSQCMECAGTYGYIIQPYDQFRGLYKVTLRMTHRIWKEKGEPYRDYIFLVSAK